MNDSNTNTAQMDVVINGVGYGETASTFGGQNVRFDPGMLRPYIDEKTGKPSVTINTGKYVRDEKAPGGLKPLLRQYSIEYLNKRGIYPPTGNAITSRRNDYIAADRKMLEISRKPQKFASWLEGVNTESVDGMKKLTYEYDVVSDYGEAVIDMDGMIPGRNSHPLLAHSSIPLPMIHFDVTRSARHLGVWSNGSPSLTELDIKTAGIKIGELKEKLAIGMVTGPTFGTVSTGPYPQRILTGSSTAIASKVYGVVAHPARRTLTTITVPTGSNPNTTYSEVLTLLQTLLESNQEGPFTLFHSIDWNRFMDNDYAWISATGWALTPELTLRAKLKEHPQITDVVLLNWLTNTYTLVLVPNDSRYVGAIRGMGLTTVQWPGKGGQQQNWKSMEIWAPLFRFDYEGYLPVYHATTA